MKICGYINGTGKVPATQKKSEKTAKNAMTDGFVERIKSLAKEDAQKGIYMDKGYLQLQHSQMKQCVSPDRSGPYGPSHTGSSSGGKRG